MAKKKTKARTVIKVRYRVGGTTVNEQFTAREASVTILRGSRAVLVFKDGADDEGPVDSVQYAKVVRVLRRPAGKRGKR